jgi:ubiquinone/menaquinone biosynthesis C-methylase UbiE
MYLVERQVLNQLRPLVAGAAMGQVLEIGAGTGANFSYYTTAKRIIATEPDPFMLQRARDRVAACECRVVLCCCVAESLPFVDSSFDTVVVTLVLCTVDSLAYALAEIRRVLKPGGVLCFIEHVRADDGWLGYGQDLLAPAWRWCVAGCHLNRRSAAAIEAAGLTLVEVQQRHLGLLPLIVGTARRTA